MLPWAMGKHATTQACEPCLPDWFTRPRHAHADVIKGQAGAGSSQRALKRRRTAREASGGAAADAGASDVWGGGVALDAGAAMSPQLVCAALSLAQVVLHAPAASGPPSRHPLMCACGRLPSASS